MYSELNNEATNGEPSPEGSETETTDIMTAPNTSSYGSTLVEENLTAGFQVPVCAVIFYIMGFFGFFCSLSLREALSVAIVDMVNQTTVIDVDIQMTNNSDQDVCPRDPEVEDEGGQLNWDRFQQTVVLSAFYYGYGLTQVCLIKI